jgi:Zn-dependent peptidase ImmA (M78 family)
VIYRKFLDRGWITEVQYTEAAARWAEQRQAGEGGDFYWNKISYLGRDYIGLAFQRYYQNRIDDSQLADYLETKPKNVGTLEGYYTRSSA